MGCKFSTRVSEDWLNTSEAKRHTGIPKRRWENNSECVDRIQLAHDSEDLQGFVTKFRVP